MNLADEVLRRFADVDAGGFFHTAHDGSATGLGTAWSLRLGADRFASASRQLAELGLPAEARCFVGFSFDPDGSTAPEWSSFDPLRRVIPRAVVVRTDGGTRLILALTDAKGEDRNSR